MDRRYLPEDWKLKKLIDVTDLITCGVAKRPEYVDTGIPFLSARNVKNGQVIWDNYKYISDETHAELTKYNKPRKGDILYTRVGSFGEAAIIDKESEFSVFVSLTLIKTKEQILNSFLKYYLNSNSVKILAKNSISGSGVGNLNVGTVRNFLIPVPPLDEQKRIVAILDEAFEGIEQAIRNTEKNLANARELFDSYLNKIFTQKGDGWEDKKIDDICSKVEYGSSSKSKPEGTIPVLRMGNIQNGSIDWSDLVYSDDQEEIEKYLLKYNDVLFNRTNSDAHVGKTAINKSKRQAIFAGYLIRIDYKKEIIDPDFLNFYLNSYRAREYGKSVMSRSVNQANINGTKLKEYPIPLPPLFLQKQIVENLVFLSRETQRLETIYRQKLAALNELKQSILQKAFTGQLTK